MRVLIVEDEAPAARRLARLVRELRPAATLLGPSETVAEARVLLTDSAPDVLLCDIELGDGLSFRLWDDGAGAVPCPVIFTTAYDRYAVQAFRVNGVDYLLKPVRREELAAAFTRLDARSAPQLDAALVGELVRAAERRSPGYRTRVLTSRRGGALVPLPITEVAHFYSEDRVTFAVALAGTAHAVGESIAQLAEELDPAAWFQINRGQLVHIDAVAHASPYLNHRLKLTLAPPSAGGAVVARERARAFRAWLGGENPAPPTAGE